MKITKQELKKINKKFDEYKTDIDKSFEFIEGKEKIILSAPHSVRQFRNGKIKGKDMLTGAMTILLQKNINCYCIYKTKNINDDANYDIENNDYKDKIIEIVNKDKIKFLLDIHGAKDGQEFDVDIGTDNLKNLNKKTEYVIEFLKIAEKYGINATVDKIFKASTQHTISNTIARKTKIPCMQIEIAKKYRNIEEFDNIKKILDFLEEFLKKVIQVGG